MKLLAAFFRAFFTPSLFIYTNNFHARFINDWLDKPERWFLHPACRRWPKGIPNKVYTLAPIFTNRIQSGLLFRIRNGISKLPK